MMRLGYRTLLPLLFQFWISLVVATTGTTCSKQSTLPTLQYTISPDFIWFPSGATAPEIVDQFRASNPQLQITSNAGGSKAVIQSRIRNFLNTQCVLHLTVTVEKWASAQQSLGLVNQTLGSTDLMCRLATHKLGKTYTDSAHIMLSSRLKGSIVAPGSKTLSSAKPGSNRGSSQTLISPGNPSSSPTVPKVARVLKRAAQRHYPKASLTESPDAAGFEYSITCPRMATATTRGDPTPLEGLKGLAMIRDCEWCRKAVAEMQGVCGSEAEGIEGIGDLASYMKQSGWGYGGGICDKC